MRWWVCWLLAACGDNLVDEPADQHSGSRLKLYWYDYDGAREVASRAGFYQDGSGRANRFYDLERAEDCTTIEWLDGTIRCTPGIGPTEPFDVLTYATTVYADAGCAQLIGRGAPQADYFLHGEWKANRFYPSLVIHRGRAIPGPAGGYYERRDGECVGPVENDEPTYELASSISGSELVEVERRELAATTRIGHLADLSDDGMLLRDAFHDHELDTDCYLLTVHGLSTVCAPDAAACIDDLFLDADCTRPGASSAEDVRFAYSETSNCVSYFRRGDLVTTPVYHQVAGACVETTPPAGETVFEIGPPVTLAEVDLVPAPSLNRLTDLHAQGSSDDPAVALFDTDATTICGYDDFFHRPDGRCLPAPWGADDAYGDPNCVQPIQISQVPAGTCDNDARYATSDFERYHEIIGVIDSAFTHSETGRCIPLVPTPGYAVHALGRTVLRSEFVRGVPVVDP